MFVHFALGVVAEWSKVLIAVPWPLMVRSTLALGTFQLWFISCVFHVNVIFSFVHFISLYTLGGLHVFRKPLQYNRYLFNLRILNHILIKIYIHWSTQLFVQNTYIIKLIVVVYLNIITAKDLWYSEPCVLKPPHVPTKSGLIYIWQSLLWEIQIYRNVCPCVPAKGVLYDRQPFITVVLKHMFLCNTSSNAPVSVIPGGQRGWPKGF